MSRWVRELILLGATAVVLAITFYFETWLLQARQQATASFVFAPVFWGRPLLQVGTSLLLVWWGWLILRYRPHWLTSLVVLAVGILLVFYVAIAFGTGLSVPLSIANGRGYVEQTGAFMAVVALFHLIRTARSSKQ